MKKKLGFSKIIMCIAIESINICPKRVFVRLVSLGMVIDMNVREAIKELQLFADNKHVYTHNLRNACKLAIIILEKQTPKKPKKENEESLFCPTCDCFLGSESVCMKRKFHTPHCSCCGQAIDWGER